MIINSAKFVVSNSDIKKCPAPTLPEFAFIGRSNVGKSSLINMLTNNNKLAKTSGKPGKTQLINHFLINEVWYLVDLPGYGYAKTSKINRKKWAKFIEQYLLVRENLLTVFVLVDLRLETQTNDLEFMMWCAEHQLHFTMIFTKADKLTKAKIDKNVASYKRKMLQFWEEMPPYFVTSSESKEGREEVLNYIDELSKIFGD